jgi:hypothetical protein
MKTQIYKNSHQNRNPIICYESFNKNMFGKEKKPPTSTTEKINPFH